MSFDEILGQVDAEHARRSEKARAKLVQANEKLDALTSEFERSLRTALATMEELKDVTIRRSKSADEENFVSANVAATARTERLTLRLSVQMFWQVGDGFNVGLGAVSDLHGEVTRADGHVRGRSESFQFPFANPVIVAPPRCGIDATTLCHQIEQAVRRLG